MKPNLQENTSDLSLDGLEELLNSTAAETASDTTFNTDDNQDWTVEETARALGLTRGAVIRRLEDKIFPGYKVKRSFGWTWRVRANWFMSNNADDASRVVNDQFKVNDQNHSPQTNESQQIENEIIEVLDAPEESSGLSVADSTAFREIIELKTRLQMTESQFQDTAAKLETANYRIGYLEARLEASQEQIKLLTDSRRNQPWWHRWRQWFITQDP